MALKIQTGGVYKDARGCEVLIVMEYPDGKFYGAQDTVSLADGRSHVHAYKDQAPWRRVEEINHAGGDNA
ncbi:hypothetical protein CQ052_02355 [Ochrobactrum sp. MYb15]|uniref:hypothetical protein n=1 Tax=Brucella TaxID=234 RepID=UPI0004638269|nr:hypothetical protein [Brucella rhizosphaerae]PQZ49469.1 hypothetical protein CQZ90_13230 [Ochrobactrum sp. MYb19]PRA57309.1 hypothetical protein CQ062_00665 [Ochrobactrum sp. MYb68]PRA66713.1 hypothetical protein CQ053_05090 [Ochrobactrum sp. MYb18]PRA76258.1 hypothetical protein CQ049_02355 [Brucella thiophenivorans]PRA91723.1 hypothetical protein CQ051_06105 [Ochrobactrum sp. MYb14]PRA98264.1 hypothetical protein CQ052_02355 [Ochrobactrum sp. MYb15]